MSPEKEQVPRPWHNPRSELRRGAFQLTRRVRFRHVVPKEHISKAAMSHSLWPQRGGLPHDAGGRVFQNAWDAGIDAGSNVLVASLVGRVAEVKNSLVFGPEVRNSHRASRSPNRAAGAAGCAEAGPRPRCAGGPKKDAAHHPCLNPGDDELHHSWQGEVNAKLRLKIDRNCSMVSVANCCRHGANAGE